MDISLDKIINMSIGVAFDHPIRKFRMNPIVCFPCHTKGSLRVCKLYSCRFRAKQTVSFGSANAELNSNVINTHSDVILITY